MLLQHVILVITNRKQINVYWPLKFIAQIIGATFIVWKVLGTLSVTISALLKCEKSNTWSHNLFAGKYVGHLIHENNFFLP